MFAIFVGIILFAFAVFTAFPFGLGWSSEVIAFLKGGLPVFAVLAGLVAFWIGIADINDKKEALREEKELLAEDKDE